MVILKKRHIAAFAAMFMIAAFMLSACGTQYNNDFKKESSSSSELTPDGGNSKTTGNDEDTSEAKDPGGNDSDKSKQKQDQAPKTAANQSKYGVLKDRIICIDPGHQAKVNNSPERIAPSTDATKEKMSWGTAGVSTGVPEYKLNLSVSLKLKKALQDCGTKVVMTRETDDVDIGNIERAEIANSSKSEILVRIHADGSENASVKGISVLYPGNKYISDNKMLGDSKKAASFVLESLINSTGATSRGLSERSDMTGFNWSRVPVFLVEMGFMSNAQEDRLMNTAEYQDKLVAGMVDGLAEYFAYKSNK